MKSFKYLLNAATDTIILGSLVLAVMIIFTIVKIYNLQRGLLFLFEVHDQ